MLCAIITGLGLAYGGWLLSRLVDSVPQPRKSCKAQEQARRKFQRFLEEGDE